MNMSIPDSLLCVIIKVSGRQMEREMRRKRKEKYKKFYDRQREWNELLQTYGGDILDSDNFKKTDGFIQHGSMTVNNHCVNVAKCSLAISRKLGIACRERELVRGALLHDYFLYDWHDKCRGDRKRLHGFYHPGIALKNASKEYRLTDRERDIIRKHMWPLTVVPPLCREAWIVTTADKYCSLLETMRLKKGHGKRAEEAASAQPSEKKVKMQYQGRQSEQFI